MRRRGEIKLLRRREELKLLRRRLLELMFVNELFGAMREFRAIVELLGLARHRALVAALALAACAPRVVEHVSF